MITISRQMLAGMGAAGWVIGFIALLGGFLILVGIVVLALIHVANALDGPKEADHGDAADDQ